MNEQFDFTEDDDEAEHYAIRPNKTQQKKEIAALFELAEEISELSPEQISKLALPEMVHKAIIAVAGMPHKGARKRQLKFIAGQFHKMAVQPLFDQLAHLKNQSAHATREHHVAERWRDKLLAEGDAALSKLLDGHPDTDRQELRQLIRNTQKEQEQGKPPRSYRLLYRHLKTLFQQGENEMIAGLSDEELSIVNPKIRTIP